MCKLAQLDLETRKKVCQVRESCFSPGHGLICALATGDRFSTAHSIKVSLGERASEMFGALFAKSGGMKLISEGRSNSRSLFFLTCKERERGEDENKSSSAAAARAGDRVNRLHSLDGAT